MEKSLPVKNEWPEGLLHAQKQVQNRNIDFRNVLGSKPKKRDFEGEPGKLGGTVLYQIAIKNHLNQLMLLAARDEGKMIDAVRSHLKKHRLIKKFQLLLGKKKQDFADNKKAIGQFKIIDQVIP